MKRDHWGSRIGFVLAASGSAIGLGNIWRFPYIAGESGGGAFVVFYLFCSVIIGLPVMLGEWIIGKRQQSDPVTAFSSIAREHGTCSKFWGFMGSLGVLAAFLVLSFYSVVGGWTLAYTFKSVTLSFDSVDSVTISEIFGSMLSSPIELIVWHTIFMILTTRIVIGGVEKGIERAVRVLMPIFLALLVALALGASVTASPGKFKSVVEFMFSFDFGKLDAKVAITALGHAFFSLSLGTAIMISYGSYLAKESGGMSLLSNAMIVVIFDLLVALVGAFVIFPIVFSQNLEVASGPGLVFITLPNAFSGMGGVMGIVVAVGFFFLLFFAALTSSISMLEPQVSVLMKFGIKRLNAAMIAGGAVWILGVLVSFSFNIMSGYSIGGVSVNLFEILDQISAKLLMPVNALAVVIFFMWYMSREEVRQELKLSPSNFSMWIVVAKYVAPLAISLVFVSGLIDLILELSRQIEPLFQ